MTALKGDIGPFQLFAFGFGSIIGSAWCVLAGSWLAAAGPGGAVIGFATGGIIVACIGACYAELTSRIPVTGGEFSFAFHIFGPATGFFVGWFIALAWICVAIFEGLAIAWLLERLVPGLRDVPLYTVLDSSVTRNQLLVGGLGAPLIALLNYRGGQTLAKFHSLLTYGFILLAVGISVLMLFHGKAANLEPLLVPGKPAWWQGAAGIFADCAFLLCGFQAITQVVEEKSDRIGFKMLFRILVLSVGTAAAFLCLVVVATAIMMPWLSLPPHSLAYVESARLLPWGHALAALVLAVAIMSLLKTWNGVFLMASRTLIALTRSGLLPGWLNRRHGPSGVPAPVVAVIFGFNLLGLTLGRGAIGTLVDTITISLVFGYAVCTIGLVVLRLRQPVRPGVVPTPSGVLWTGVIGSVVMACTAVAMPLFTTGRLPTVYLIFPVWALIGTVTYLVTGHRAAQSALQAGET